MDIPVIRNEPGDCATLPWRSRLGSRRLAAGRAASISVWSPARASTC